MPGEPPMIGTRLMHYEILEKLGEGGMGVVYKACDTRLDRFVALKVLPEGKVSDPDRKQRFIREAKAASALNHPNIIHIYDIDSTGKADFIAMEYVGGRTLDQCIGRKGVPLTDALKFAIQIAEALAAAHAAGIVHRDLKPANIMVAENGSVKVLDFGLAKLMEPAETEAQDSDATRSTKLLTKEGIIIGTAAYMSPEQAEGKRISARSDIFSFGSVLYEMVTGRRAFAGESSLSSLAGILHQEPQSVSELVGGVPGELEKIIQRCLRKNPEHRFQHMDDVGVLLREILDEGSAGRATATVPVPASQRRRTALQVGAAVVLLLLGITLGTYWSGLKQTAIELPLRKFQVEVKGDIRTIGFSDSPMGPAISPDGKMVAYTQDDRLWIQDLSRLKPREIADTQGAVSPFWSPDSDFVVYAAKGALKRVSAQGGPSSVLCELRREGSFLGGSWGTAGSIAVGISALGLFEVPAQGGELKPLLTPDPSKGEFDFHSPHYLPDGRTFMFTVHPTSGYQYRLALRAGQVTRPLLGESAGNVSSAVYSASGHVIYQRVRGSRSIYAVPFQLASLSVSGESFLVAEEGAKPSVSRDGTLVYELARPEELAVVDRNGQFQRVVADGYEQIRFPAFSPDGGRVAFTGVQDGNHDIWIHDLARGSKTRLTVDTGMDTTPAWSPSGEYIAYASGTSIKMSLFSRRSDGSGETKSLVSVETSVGSPEWSPDGRSLVYLLRAPKGRNAIWQLSLTGNTQSRPFLETPFAESNPKISPNGRYIAYTSDESGRNEVYVRPFPQGQGSWPVSVNGGTLPRWNRGGNELFYVEGNTLMAVPVDTGAAFRAGTPRKLFSGDELGIGLYSFSPVISAYDASPDGRNFVAVRRMGGSGNYLTIVQNWLTEFQNRR